MSRELSQELSRGLNQIHNCNQNPELNRELVVGVDLGGTKILTVLADSKGQVLAKVNVPTEVSRGQDYIIAKIIESIQAVQRDTGAAPGAVQAIGMGVAGLTDPDHGFVHFAPNLGWRDVPLGQIMHERLNIPIYLDNDANLAALGEHVYGAGRGADDMVYITVSTGVGGGLIFGGRVYHGAGGGAGEIGHITVMEDGPACRCGNTGCLEALASGTAISLRAAALVAEGRGRGILAAAAGDKSKISARVVAKAALNGDGEAQAVMQEAGRYLGIALSGLVNLLSPSLIVLGGGVMQSKSGELLWEAILEQVICRSMGSSLKKVRIIPSVLGSDSSVMGAVALAVGGKANPGL